MYPKRNRRPRIRRLPRMLEPAGREAQRKRKNQKASGGYISSAGKDREGRRREKADAGRTAQNLVWHRGTPTIRTGRGFGVRKLACALCRGSLLPRPAKWPISQVPAPETE